MAYYLLFYDVVDDFVEHRAPFRQAHLMLANEAHDRGELIMAGAFGDPVTGATLLFHADDPSVAEQFAATDPYVKEGLVPSWRVHRWHEVLTSQ
jgi:uncharacterized protein